MLICQNIELFEAFFVTKFFFILGFKFNISRCLRFFKFFPANLFGGIPTLKTYKNVFPHVIFCPTGGINKDSYLEYLELDNVLSVGGSWMMKNNSKD